MEGISIDRNEVLRYLGYRGQDIDTNLNELIEECIGEVRKTIEPRYIYKFFALKLKDESLSLEGSIITFKSADLLRHLKGSEKCALIAVTLGSEIDTRIRYYERADMTRAVLLDACATAAVEEACDRVCEVIGNEVKPEGKILTSRFSPGYGDLPLDIQKSFISVLEAERSIGLTASAESILIPRKSVTAVVGFVDRGLSRKRRDCSNCSKFSECRYKRREGGCGY